MHCFPGGKRGQYLCRPLTGFVSQSRNLVAQLNDRVKILTHSAEGCRIRAVSRCFAAVFRWSLSYCPLFGAFPSTRWAPTIYKWTYNPYKWPYKWVTGVITLLIGIITPVITGRGPTFHQLEYIGLCQVVWLNESFPRMSSAPEPISKVIGNPKLHFQKSKKHPFNQ